MYIESKNNLNEREIELQNITAQLHDLELVNRELNDKIELHFQELENQKENFTEEIAVKILMEMRERIY